MTPDSGAEVEVVRSITVPLTQAKTFELFTSRMSEFWPPEHSIGAAPFEAVVLEPRVGGRWYERARDGAQTDWGRVGAWEPTSRVVLIWQITGQWKFDPDFETEVEVRFLETDPGRTTIDLHHRHLQRFGEMAEQMRAAFDSPGGWIDTLNRCARLAESQ
ncbi:SRPBCC family protein [Mycolicibacterium sp. XJ1819]